MAQSSNRPLRLLSLGTFISLAARGPSPFSRPFQTSDAVEMRSANVEQMEEGYEGYLVF